MNLQTELENVQNEIIKQKNWREKGSNLFVQEDLNALETQEADVLRRMMEEKEQVLEAKVEEAKTTGYLLDTLTASNGMTMAELSYSPENHELVCIAVQKSFLVQQDAFNAKINNLETEVHNALASLGVEQYKSDSLERVNFTLEQEKQDALQKRDNAVRLAEELQSKLDQQAKGVVEIAPMSAEEQETKLINEMNGKRIKVTNVKPRTDAINELWFTATNVLTGLVFEDRFLYIKRYEEISQEEANQLRADYAQKKADIEAQNAPQEIVQLQTIDEPSGFDDLPRIDHEITGEQFRFSYESTETEPVVQPTEEATPTDHTELPTAATENVEIPFTQKHELDIYETMWSLAALTQRIAALEAVK